MPTFAGIPAIDRLVEPKSAAAAPTNLTLHLPPVKLERREENGRKGGGGDRRGVPIRNRVIPALYATPEATPLPDSPSSFPPSPYIVNHKRRGPRLLKTFSQGDVGVGGGADGDGGSGPPPVKSFSQGDVAVASASGGGPLLSPVRRLSQDDVAIASGDSILPPVRNFSQGDVVFAGVDLQLSAVGKEDVLGVGAADDTHGEKVEDGMPGDELAWNEGKMDLAAVGVEGEVEGDDFFDPRDSMSVASSTEVEDGNGPDRAWKPSTPLGEFYDAFEEISSDGIIPSPHPNLEAELREMKLNVLMEIERRKQAEEALSNMQNQWKRLTNQLSLVGLTLPPLSTIMEDGTEGSNIDPAEDLQQQIILARLVAGSIGRGCTRAEVEIEMESRIELKNFEIARLWDRLRYYETANREMSQRNQEAVEMARQQRHRRKRRQRWIWGSIGLAIAAGTAVIAWSYLPASSSSDLAKGDSADRQQPK